MALNINSVLQSIDIHHQPVYVAFSGGCDSTVLLHLLREYKIHAIHVNHHLQPASNQWEEHCQKICDSLNIPLEVISINIDEKSNIEAIAREKRYKAISAVLPNNALLLTAHHADDLMETMLLHLCKGGGVKGLAGIPERNNVYGCDVIRPLLSFSKKIIKTYAHQNQLTWIDDPSNDKTHFDRNYLRQEVIPLLKERFPELHKTMKRSSEHFQLNATLEETVFAELKKKCLGNKKLSIKALKTLEKKMLYGVLRSWLKDHADYAPATQVLKQIFDTVIQAKEDAFPQVIWKDKQIRRFQDNLYCISYPLPETKDIRLSWDTHEKFVLPFELGVLDPNHFPQLQHKNVTICFRQGGERFKPRDRIGSHPLKKLFQEWGVPPWQRSLIPLIYDENELVCVPFEQFL